MQQLFEQALQLLDNYKPVWMPLWIAILVALFIIRAKVSFVARLIRGGVTILAIIVIAYMVTRHQGTLINWFERITNIF